MSTIYHIYHTSISVGRCRILQGWLWRTPDKVCEWHRCAALCTGGRRSWWHRSVRLHDLSWNLCEARGKGQPQLYPQSYWSGWVYSKDAEDNMITDCPTQKKLLQKLSKWPWYSSVPRAESSLHKSLITDKSRFYFFGNETHGSVAACFVCRHHQVSISDFVFFPATTTMPTTTTTTTTTTTFPWTILTDIPNRSIGNVSNS